MATIITTTATTALWCVPLENSDTVGCIALLWFRARISPKSRRLDDARDACDAGDGAAPSLDAALS
jgi:hypothetical protein